MGSIVSSGASPPIGTLKRRTQMLLYLHLSLSSHLNMNSLIWSSKWLVTVCRVGGSRVLKCTRM